MKTKEQIKYFLKGKKYKSEVDFTFINAFCVDKHKYRLHVPSSYSNIPEAIDCQSFMNWLEYGYGGGDIVKWGNSIGLVVKSSTDCVEIGFSINSNGISEEKFTLSNHLLTSGSESDQIKINEALEAAGKEFGNPNLSITAKFVPESGNLVYFKKHDCSLEGYGAVRLVDKNTGDVVMYCYVTISGEPYYGMDKHIGKITDFKFTPFGAADYPRKLMENAFEKVGKTWNHSLKRIEPIDMKVSVGEKYWYITDKMTVTSDIEKNRSTSHKRYLVANYFRNEADAYKILSAEMELRRNFLANPEGVPFDPVKNDMAAD